MAIPKKTKQYLDKKLAKYDELSHRTVYTAYDAAQTLKRELREIAKGLLIATDKAYVIAVIPANKNPPSGVSTTSFPMSAFSQP